MVASTAVTIYIIATTWSLLINVLIGVLSAVIGSGVTVAAIGATLVVCSAWAILLRRTSVVPLVTLSLI